jgi:Flp pilus assembly protein TadG
MTCPIHTRRGVAAVEFALVAPVLFGVLLGLWEIGRAIQVEQLLSAAAREGGRVAAQGWIISLANGTQQVTVSSTNPADVTVTRTVTDFLTQAGINTTGLQVTFQFVSGNTALAQPWQAAKGQWFQITLTLPYSNVAIAPMTLTGGTNLTATVVWVSVVDDPFQIDATIPQ